jgi:hypothetical protein
MGEIIVLHIQQQGDEANFEPPNRKEHANLKW